MRERLAATALTVLVACLGIPPCATGQTTPDALLSLPPSPGVEVMLLPHATDARVQQRWREALTDQDPDRRAAAARAIGIAGLRTAIAGLASVAKTETDAVARAEMLRALVVIGSSVTDETVLQRLDQMPVSTTRRVVRAIATLRPAPTVDFLLRGGMLGEERSRASFRAADAHARLRRTNPAEAMRLEAQPEKLAASTLQGLLHLAHLTARRSVPVALLLAGLSTDVHTAGEVVSYLPAVFGRPNDIDPQFRDAYTSWRATRPTSHDATHDFLLALADRWIGVVTPTSVEVDRVDATVLAGLQLPAPAFAVLSRDERRALVQRLGWDKDAGRLIERAEFEAPSVEGAWSGESGARGLALLADLPGAVLSDLGRLTGCTTKAGEVDLALTVAYRPDGRPLPIGVGAKAPEAPCDRLALLVARASYGEPSIATDPPGRTLLRLSPDFVACQRDRDAEARAPAVEVPAGQPITPPRKIKDQKPVYPQAAQDKRIEGVVIIESLLTQTGCIAEARVVRSIPALDLAALQAVTAWRYAPAERGGGRVTVQLTLTVSFRL